MREISVLSWNQIARRIFGYQRQPALELEDLIRSVAVLQSDRPEWHFTAGELLFIGGASVAAGGAGTTVEVALVNPANSGRLIVVEGATGDVPFGTTFSLQATIEAAFTAGATQQSRDLRQVTAAGASQAAAGKIWSRNNTAGFGGVVFRSQIYAPAQWCPFMVAPGFGVVLQSVTQNVAGSFYFSSREIAFEDT